MDIRLHGWSLSVVNCQLSVVLLSSEVYTWREREDMVISYTCHTVSYTR